MANVYPPSPALSACDSLADIEDLDTFLNAQGQLSHWPTPPSQPTDKKADILVETFDLGCESPLTDSDIDDEDLDAFLDAQGQLSHWPTPPSPTADRKVDSVVQSPYSDCESSDTEGDVNDEIWRIASALTDIATGRHDPDQFDHVLVLNILIRAAVPQEVLALAYNILKVVAASVRKRAGVHALREPDHAVTACLSLAYTFISDRPPPSGYWAKDVCSGTWAAHQIDMLSVQFAINPDVHMLALSAPSAIGKALEELYDIADTPSAERNEGLRPGHTGDPKTSDDVAPAPLTIALPDSARWTNGAVTPAETPVDEKGPFLRLL